MAHVDSRRLRSGSLSSGSDSESGSGSIDEDSRAGRMKSAIVQVPPDRLKPTLSPAPRPALSDGDNHSSSRYSASPPPHKKHRSLITPSPPSYRHRDRPSSLSRNRRQNSHSPPSSKRRGASPPSSYHHKDEHTAYKWGRQRRTPSPQSSSEYEDHTPSPKRKREEPDPLTTRTGGAYIPPARLRMMQAGITDKSSVAYQRVSWEALKKSINGLINKVNVSNIDKIVPELFEENVVRGRGLMSRSVIQAQAASPMFSHVYAALVAVINTKFPQTGELICKRLILQFRKGFKRNDKNICMTAVKFLAHLVNQQVLHELVALELLTLLMEEPSDDTVEVAVGFIKECGLKLTDVSPRGIHAMFETLRSILHSGKISPRIQYMIEVLFAIRKDKFKDHPAVIDGLDLVEEDDQITHLLSLTDEIDGEEALNVFHLDPDFVANEEKYKIIKAEILGDGSGSEESGSESSEGEESSEAEDEEDEAKMEISDMTDANVLALRRTIYLTIMSSANYEECVHKLLRNKQEGSESEIANMVIECCSQERSYLRFYGLLSQRLCLLNQAWVAVFDEAFQQQYATVHRLETNKLRNTARLFAQLFYSDALPWTALSCVHLNEEETNSSSRIFVKILVQELSEFMGMVRLNERLRDPLLSVSFEGLLPRDNPKNTRFAINFFTSIGLGGLTDDLREHLKNAQKMIMEQKQDVSSSDTDSSSSEEEDSTSEETSSEDSSEASSSSEEDKRHSRYKGRQSSSHKHRSKGRRSPVSDSEDERSKRRDSPDRSQRKKGGDRHEGSQRKRRGDSSDRPQRKRRVDSPERSQRKRRGDSPERSQRKRRVDSPERSQRKRKGDSPEISQRKREGDSPERSQRKREGDSPERSQRKRRGDSPERSQRKRRGDSPERSQRKRRGDSPEISQRKREGDSPESESRKRDRVIERNPKSSEGRESKRREASGSPEKAQRDSSSEREVPPRREKRSRGQREERERHGDRDSSRNDSRSDYKQMDRRRHRGDKYRK